MAEEIKRRPFRVSGIALLLWLNSLTFLLWGLHLISVRWVVGIFFVLLIPFATVKAFMDYRRKSL